MDLTRFPQLASYVAQLPAGFASYPECRGITQGLLPFFTPHREVFREAGVPAELRQLGEDMNELPKWLPDVVFNAGYHYMRDTIFASDDELTDYVLAKNGEVFAQPMFRALFFIMSPSLVFSGATNRWSVFHQGTSLSAKKMPEGRAALLTYPPHLWSPLNATATAPAFHAALEAASAKGVVVEVKEHTPTQSLFTLTWK